MKRHAWGLLFLASLVANTCMAASPFGPLRGVRVVGTGNDALGMSCPDLPITNAAASKLLARVVVVSARQIHDRYETGPCWVRGVAEVPGETWSWEYRAGGTVRARSSGGEVILLADPRQGHAPSE
ncbi:hypothetical protein [Lysobacter sp. HA35]